MRIGGGTSTIRQYLQARLIDEMHIATTRVTLGSGESLFEGVKLLELGYRAVETVESENAIHIVYRRNEEAR